MIVKIKQNIINSLGWRTKRKIIVIESDDWGSIRMRSKEDYNFFIKKGYQVDKSSYDKYDSLESNNDLIALFEVLDKYTGKEKNSPIFTFNTIVANPYFKKIKQSNFQEYFYEPFTETLKKYPKHDKVLSLYKEGINNKLIMPQFHGKEHLSVKRWMSALQGKEKKSITAFDREMFTVYKSGNSSGRSNYLDTFGLGDRESLNQYNKMIGSGMEIFKEVFNFSSKSFIAPTYVWPSEIEQKLAKEGVKYIQGTHVQRVPKLDHNKGIRRKYHYLGQKNDYNQIYLIRNAFFEPSSNESKDWVSACLYDISRAFKWDKPAIISSHRVNYIGGIFPSNRLNGIKLLNELLSKIINIYPDVEFMSSDQLGDLITKK